MGVPTTLALALLLLAPAACFADLATTTVFTHGERDDCVCIRGPQLLLAANTTMVAFAGCVPTVGDNCQPLRPKKPPSDAVHRLVYKRSTDVSHRYLYTFQPRGINN